MVSAMQSRKNARFFVALLTAPYLTDALAWDSLFSASRASRFKATIRSRAPSAHPAAGERRLGMLLYP